MDHARKRSRIGAIFFLAVLGAWATLDLDWMGSNGDGGCGCDAAITSALITLSGSGVIG